MNVEQRRALPCNTLLPRADDRYWWPLLLREDEPSFQGLFGFRDTHALAWWRLREAPRGEALGDVRELLPPAEGEGAEG